MESLIKIVGLLGIGGLVSSYLTILWQRRNTEEKAKQEYKETRYKCVVLLMKALVEFKKYQKMLINHGYDISNREDLIDLLRDEQLSAILYASKGFIKSMGEFIIKPNKDNLISTVIEMRKDLWRLKGKLGASDIFGDCT
ncbi:MAG: hypothetical protein ABIG61_01055 [Planctomycetota bacterium]